MAKTTVSTAGSESKARRAREYETIYILRPSVSADEADRVAKRFTDVVGTLQGKLIKLDSWGWRRLAYPIKGATRGVFIYARYAGFDDLVAELERNLRLLDPVVRYQTVLLNPQVNMDDIQVDPADVALQPLAPSDLEDDITIAQRLGLMERHPHPRAEAPAGESAQRPPAAGSQDEATASAEAETAGAEAASAEAASADAEKAGEEKAGAEKAGAEAAGAGAEAASADAEKAGAEAAGAEAAGAGDAAQPEKPASEPEPQQAPDAEGASGEQSATGGEPPAEKA